MSQTGLTFIEILISLILLSIGLLSIAKFNVLSLQTQYFSYQEAIAITQIIAMKNRIKANFSKLSEESVLWNKTNQALLPHSKGEVICQGKQCQIQLKWQYHGDRFLSASISN